MLLLTEFAAEVVFFLVDKEVSFFNELTAERVLFFVETIVMKRSFKTEPACWTISFFADKLAVYFLVEVTLVYSFFVEVAAEGVEVFLVTDSFAMLLFTEAIASRTASFKAEEKAALSVLSFVDLRSSLARLDFTAYLYALFLTDSISSFIILLFSDATATSVLGFKLLEVNLIASLAYSAFFRITDFVVEFLTLIIGALRTFLMILFFTVF